jgi:hypothetical protein
MAQTADSVSDTTESGPQANACHLRQMADELQVPPQRLSFQWLVPAITTALHHWPLQTPGTFPNASHDYASRHAPISRRNVERDPIQESSNSPDPSFQWKMPVSLTDWHWPAGRFPTRLGNEPLSVA